MGWRFRRSFKLLPGVRLNVGKTGFTSVSVGGRGARLNIGKRGMRQTIGLPGMGLSYTQRLNVPTGGPSPSGQTTTNGSPHPFAIVGTIVGLVAVLMSLASGSYGTAISAGLLTALCLARLIRKPTISNDTPSVRPTPTPGEFDSLRTVFGLASQTTAVDRSHDVANVKYEANLDHTHLSNLFQNTPPAVPAVSAKSLRTVNLSEGFGFAIGIVGESYRQQALKNLSAGRRRRGEDVFFTACLIDEPGNPYDANAVQVTSSDRTLLGYLAAADAKAYQPVCHLLTSQDRLGTCNAKLIGGTPSKPSLGVVLDLMDADKLLEAVTAGEQPF